MTRPDQEHCPGCDRPLGDLFPPDGEHDPEKCAACQAGYDCDLYDVDGPYWYGSWPRSCPVCGVLLWVPCDDDVAYVADV